MPSNRSLYPQAGSATVEFAFVLPFLILILLVAFDFGQVFNKAIAVSSAAQSGANYGMQLFWVDGNLTSTDVDNIKSAVEKLSVSCIQDNDIQVACVTCGFACSSGDNYSYRQCYANPCTNAPAKMVIKIKPSAIFNTVVDYSKLGIPHTIPLPRTAIFRIK